MPTYKDEMTLDAQKLGRELIRVSQEHQLPSSIEVFKSPTGEIWYWYRTGAPKEIPIKYEHIYELKELELIELEQLDEGRTHKRVQLKQNLKKAVEADYEIERVSNTSNATSVRIEGNHNLVSFAGGDSIQTQVISDQLNDLESILEELGIMDDKLREWIIELQENPENEEQHRQIIPPMMQYIWGKLLTTTHHSAAIFTVVQALKMIVGA